MQTARLAVVVVGFTNLFQTGRAWNVAVKPLMQPQGPIQFFLDMAFRVTATLILPLGFKFQG